MSAFGLKRTFRDRCLMSTFGCKADIEGRSRMAAFCCLHLSALPENEAAPLWQAALAEAQLARSNINRWTPEYRATKDETPSSLVLGAPALLRLK
jgi:hypothetical protein